MAGIKKRIFYLGLALALNLLLLDVSLAQRAEYITFDGPGNCNPDECFDITEGCIRCIPIDGGLLYLLLAGGIFGIKRIRDRRK
jgi:hypothetical protein